MGNTWKYFELRGERTDLLSRHNVREAVRLVDPGRPF